jgi:hypothetical protein
LSDLRPRVHALAAHRPAQAFQCGFQRIAVGELLPGLPQAGTWPPLSGLRSSRLTRTARSPNGAAIPEPGVTPHKR